MTNASLGKTLIFIPTYNERGNVEKMCAELSAQNLDADILFVDDNSPDGTGNLLEELRKEYPRMQVRHRSGKLGIGSAHYEGINLAYDLGYQTLITMDCDFTHPPDYIPRLIEIAHEADVVVGSRYRQKKSLAGWNFYRKFLTWTGHFLTKVLLRMDYDATGAFRLYRLDRVPRDLFKLVTSRGYSFFFESLYILHFNEFKILEVPISLPPRTYGHSKMSSNEIFRSVKLLFWTYMTAMFNREKYILAESVKLEQINSKLRDNQGWDEYWIDQKGSGGLLYEVIAAFYRKFIIRRILHYFVIKYFKPGSQILHAGCGGGQVDMEISNHIEITGLDISVNALNLYNRAHRGRCRLVHGSIFEIPLDANSVDGIYNLGVMEHFTEGEIGKIFGEFKRVTKPGGRLVIFWPPEFGVSVIFLKGVKWVLENVFGKKGVKIHPDEITRVQSRRHVVRLFESAGFQVVRYYFGPMDLFTYSVIVADKPVELSSEAGREQERGSMESSNSLNPRDLTPGHTTATI